MGDKVKYFDEYRNEAEGTIVGFVSPMNNVIVAIIRTKVDRYIQRPIENIEYIY